MAEAGAEEPKEPGRKASRDLRPLFEPRSVAVVGASNDPLKWGFGLARGALRGRHRRAVYLVNRSGAEILGVISYRSLAEVPEPVELVVVAVPERHFEETVDQALARGARAIVGVTAGLGELGPEGRAREEAVVERVRAAGAVLLGPNCLGVFDARAELDIGWDELPAGEIGLVSQSGNLALELALLAREYDLGFSRFASLGNQADLEAADLVEAFASDPATRLIALYIEDFRHGRRFVSACADALAGGTPVVLLAAGRSEAASRAARSHTGALVSDLVAVDAASRAAGIVQVSTPRELVDAAQALLAGVRPRGRRLAVFGDGGGHCVIAADQAHAAGFELPRLGEGLRAELAAALGPTAATANPVDLAGGGEQDLGRFELVARLLLSSGEVDALLLTGFFGGYGTSGEEIAAREAQAAAGMAAAAAELGRPIVVQTMYPALWAAVAFRAGGVPVYREIEAAVRALAVAARIPELPPGVPELPAAAAPVDESALGYFGARRLLEEAGIPFAPAHEVATLEEAKAAAAELGYPVVLKALGRLHKSDAGGVVLGIGGEAELALAFSDLTPRLEPARYSVERMASAAGGVELLVGARRDPRFGPVALVGLGGLYAEVLRDAAVSLAPVGIEDAWHLLRSLRGAPLLLGARGRPPVDLAAAARTVATLSEVAAAHPEIAEVEINPLLVTAEGALGLDARIVLEHTADERGDDDAR